MAKSTHSIKRYCAWIIFEDRVPDAFDGFFGDEGGLGIEDDVVSVADFGLGLDDFDTHASQVQPVDNLIDVLFGGCGGDDDWFVVRGHKTQNRGLSSCMSDELTHIPVLADAVLDALVPALGEVYVDCTAGLGGHAALVADRIGPDGTIVLNDLDSGNLERAKALVCKRLRPENPESANLHAFQGNFAELPRHLKGMGGVGGTGIGADMVFADLGFASCQVDDPQRGLSFRFSGPLDMRLDQSGIVTAEELVNTLPETELVRILRDFGEEKHARRIASKLVAERGVMPITTTDRLAEIVCSAVPGPRRSINPATKTFQALRIAVNDELGSLEALLRMIGIALGKVAKGEPTWLNPGARIACIAFHSLEDRPVKRAMAAWGSDGLVHSCTRKPIGASDAEVADNPRARSAKMRVCTVAGGDA